MGMENAWENQGKGRVFFFEVGMSGSLVDPKWAKTQSDQGSAQCLRG